MIDEGRARFPRLVWAASFHGLDEDALLGNRIRGFLSGPGWTHRYLRECLGRKAAAETTCDRFALANYQREAVTTEDATAALRRR